MSECNRPKDYMTPFSDATMERVMESKRADAELEQRNAPPVSELDQARAKIAELEKEILALRKYVHVSPEILHATD